MLLRTPWCRFVYWSARDNFPKRIPVGCSLADLLCLKFALARPKCNYTVGATQKAHSIQFSLLLLFFAMSLFKLVCISFHSLFGISSADYLICYTFAHFSFLTNTNACTDCLLCHMHILKGWKYGWLFCSTLSDSNSKPQWQQRKNLHTYNMYM